MTPTPPGHSAAAVALSAAAVIPGRAERLASLRLGAISLVVLIHTSVGPANPAFAEASEGARALSAVGYRLASCLAVPVFLLVAFMGMHPRTGGARTYRKTLATRCLRLAAPFLFWTAVYGGVKLASGSVALTPRLLAEYLVLGGAAAHLYFLPLLAALTALLPLWLAIARRPAMAVATCLALPVAASYAVEALRPDDPWRQAAFGLLGTACYAVAGLALVERWRGWEPPTPYRALLAWAAAALALLAAGVLAGHALEEARASAALSPALAARTARVVFPLATAVALLASRLRPPAWTVGVAPLAFGVYLVHPFLAKGAVLATRHVDLLRGSDLLLGPALGLGVLAASTTLVLWLMGTPLRRVLA